MKIPEHKQKLLDLLKDFSEADESWIRSEKGKDIYLLRKNGFQLTLTVCRTEPWVFWGVIDPCPVAGKS